MKSLLVPMSYTPDQEACVKKAVELSGSDITVLSYVNGTVPFGSSPFPSLICNGQEQLLGFLAETEGLILVSPDFSVLYRLSLGDCPDDLSQCILRALLWGVKVWILVDYEIPKFMRDTFFGKLNDTFDALRSLGIVIDTFGGERRNAKPLAIVTESDVITAGKLGRDTIVCTEKAIVTPLAVDVSKDMRIRIVRSREC